MAGFYTCVSRKRNSAWCLSIYGQQCSQAITAFATKACALATKSHMLNFWERMRGLRCDMPWLWPMGTANAGNKMIFLFSEQKARPEKKKYSSDFEKVVISNLIPDVLRDLHSSKYRRSRYKSNDDCLWKPKKKTQ